jgi:RNA-directed DNA polymerase
LSNVYLDPLDHLAAQAGFQMVRYADDFVILCRTAQEAEAALERVQSWVAENGLTLHPTKTRIVDARETGFDFLGYHFRGTKHWPREKSLQKLKDTLRVKTKRTSGDSLPFIIGQVNQTLRGWFAYFQHSRPFVFAPLDRWIRQRLRAILRKRSKRRGCAKGWDFHRWPNAFFADRGLFSLATARRLAGQPSRR